MNVSDFTFLPTSLPKKVKWLNSQKPLDSLSVKNSKNHDQSTLGSVTYKTYCVYKATTNNVAFLIQHLPQFDRQQIPSISVLSQVSTPFSFSASLKITSHICPPFQQCTQQQMLAARRYSNFWPHSSHQNIYLGISKEKNIYTR